MPRLAKAVVIALVIAGLIHGAPVAPPRPTAPEVWPPAITTSEDF